MQTLRIPKIIFLTSFLGEFFFFKEIGFHHTVFINLCYIFLIASYFGMEWPKTFGILNIFFFHLHILICSKKALSKLLLWHKSNKEKLLEYLNKVMTKIYDK